MSVNMPKITNISRGSLHDGPGVRTVVYFKGCPLRCMWCHNPESFSFHSQTVFNAKKCIGCGKCVSACPEHHIIKDGTLTFSPYGCTGCGLCASLCPSGALSVIGEQKSAEEIFEEIKKDIHYYRVTGGGVTFSGGECLLYPDFVNDIAKLCKNEGINTLVESALCIPWENVEAVLPYIDTFFVDLKIGDRGKHKQYTGKDNSLIIENLAKLSNTEKSVVLRIPIIPGVNDSECDMEEFGEIIKGFGKAILRIELLKYNNLAEGKYNLIGEKYTPFAKTTQSDGEMSRLCSLLAEKTGLDCSF